MIEPGHGSNLPAELFLEAGARSGVAGDDLDGDITLFRHMTARVDLAHGAGADAVTNDERPEL